MEYKVIKYLVMFLPLHAPKLSCFAATSSTNSDKYLFNKLATIDSKTIFYYIKIYCKLNESQVACIFFGRLLKYESSVDFNDHHNSRDENSLCTTATSWVWGRSSYAVVLLFCAFNVCINRMKPFLQKQNFITFTTGSKLNF